LAAIVVIPARYGSTRFPAKIVASETGKPLVQHVVDRAKRATRVKDVIVATDDERIVSALRPFGTKCVMTSPAHQSGTDRIAEAARDLPAECDIVVNVQGDEPEIEPATIDALVERLETSNDPMATAATPFPAGESVENPNLVKVPYVRDAESTKPAPAAYHLHLGVYAYRREFLVQFASWPPTPLELTEKLEQLRALEHGRPIHVVKVERSAHGIDTPEQYRAFVARHRSAT
jgi:3-deoxy-manno-octulosonate cytidylyltransferase (CMP-KDO synthetase)